MRETIQNIIKDVNYSDDWPNVFVKPIKMLKIEIKNKKVGILFSFFICDDKLNFN